MEKLFGEGNIIILADSDEGTDEEHIDDDDDDEERTEAREKRAAEEAEESMKRKRMRAGKMKRSRNPYIDGSEEFKHSRDDDYADLDDFIVCRPGVIYDHY